MSLSNPDQATLDANNTTASRRRRCEGVLWRLLKTYEHHEAAQEDRHTLGRRKMTRRYESKNGDVLCYKCTVAKGCPVKTKEVYDTRSDQVFLYSNGHQHIH